MIEHTRAPLLLPWLPVPARIALMFSAMFFITGVSTPFLPLWLADRGLSAGEIGTLTIVPMLVRSLAAPSIGWEADQRRAHRALIVGLSVLGIAAWVLLWRSSGIAGALTALVLVALANTMTPLVESIAVAGVRSDGHDYGRMRFWGSASFVVANLLSSWLAGRFGVAPLIMLMTCGAVVTLAASLLLPQPATLGAAARARIPLTWTGAMTLLRVPLMPVLLLAAAALQGAHGLYYTYGTLHWRALGIDTGWFGSLWAVGLVTEVSLFWWSKAALARLGAPGLIVAGAILSVLRWSLMAFDPPLALLVPLQVLHGLTFGCAHLGAMYVLATIAPPDKGATAQALCALVSALGIVFATAISAQLFPVLGGRAYLAMAGIAVIGLGAALHLARMWSSVVDARDASRQ